MGQKPIEGSNPPLSAIGHINSRRFRSLSRGGHEARDSNPRYKQGGSTKSPKAILDVAAQLRRSVAKRRTSGAAASNPSLSASRHINSRWVRSGHRDSDEAGITHEGRGRKSRINPSLSARWPIKS